MLIETVLVCTTFLLIALGILYARRGIPPVPTVKKNAPLPETLASLVSRDKFAEWKSQMETRMKAVETQWDDTYKKMRRKEARYMAENRFDGKQEELNQEVPTSAEAVTAEDLERAHNRQRLGI